MWSFTLFTWKVQCTYIQLSIEMVYITTTSTHNEWHTQRPLLSVLQRASATDLGGELENCFRDIRACRGITGIWVAILGSLKQNSEGQENVEGRGINIWFNLICVCVCESLPLSLSLSLSPPPLPLPILSYAGMVTGV